MHVPVHQNQRRKIKGDDEVEYADTFNHSIPAIRTGIKHMKGEGDCCGGPKEKPIKKKISGPVLREVTVHIDGMHCQNCRVRIENHLNEMDGIVAKVNLNKKAATISVYKDVDDLEIQNTIEKLGYTVVSME